MKTKTASVRVPKEMYEEIDNICDEGGCARNDWIKDTIKDRLREESNENSQDQEENTPGPNRNPTPTTKLLDNSDKPTKVSHDWGKTWHDEPKEEPKPTIELIPEIKEPKPTIELISEIKEPKVIIEKVPQDNSNKPVVQFTQFNGKLLPFAKRYNQ